MGELAVSSGDSEGDEAVESAPLTVRDCEEAMVEVLLVREWAAGRLRRDPTAVSSKLRPVTACMLCTLLRVYGAAFADDFAPLWVGLWWPFPSKVSGALPSEAVVLARRLRSEAPDVSPSADRGTLLVPEPFVDDPSDGASGTVSSEGDSFFWLQVHRAPWLQQQLSVRFLVSRRRLA